MTTKEELEAEAKAFNEKAGNLKVIDCPKCHNKGYIMQVRYVEIYNDYSTVIKDCECMEKRRNIIRAEKSGLGAYLTKRFEDYIAVEDWQKEIKRKAIDYCNNNNDDWFIILGQSGCGKTLICSIIANYELVKNDKKVIYITWTDFISKLKRDMMSDNTNEVSGYLEEIKNVEVLYIDELLKKYNETDLKYIIEIINYRYTNNLKTIVSSEKNIDELLDIDEATMSRLIEKSNGYMFNVGKDRNKNYRLKGV